MQDHLLQRASSLVWHAGFSLVVVYGFSLLYFWCAGCRAHGLCTCGMQVPERVDSVVCGMRALVEARKFSSCGVQA